MPSSRVASRLASFECSSSARVLTAGIVFARGPGGADCDGCGGGDVDALAYVPWRLNETGLAVCGADVGSDGLESVSAGAKGVFELRRSKPDVVRSEHTSR